jgi:fido (protein-threonine AMPylation protein)/Fe2+ or Zn2+ uptake regulation protein
MVKKYDLFEILYSKGTPLSIKTILTILKKTSTEYHQIYASLERLTKEGLIAKNKYGFQAIMSKKNDLLYQMIHFCISNDINYHRLLDKNITKFISKALLKERFSIKDFKLNPKTFRGYIDSLSRSGLLIILSYKPLIATIPYNSFLKDLVSYFEHPAHFIKRKNKDYLKEIKKDLRLFKKLKEEKKTNYERILEKLEFQFIQHSLNLEGNPITISETISFLKDHIVPRDRKIEDIQEVENYQKAVKKMLKESENIPLTKESVLNYHYLAMYHRPEIAGKIRYVKVYIKGNPNFNIAKPEEINEKLNLLIIEYYAFMKDKKDVKQICEFAAYFHNQFQHIHPFIDGNSRTTRLLTFHIIRSKGIPIMDIPLGLLEMYLDVTKGHKKREDKELTIVLQKIILYNLKSINQQLKD